jgi:phosphatidate cytidylyltransferase
MKRVLTALVLVPLVLAAVFWLPIWVFSLAVGLVAILSTHEYLDIAEANGLIPFRKTAMFFLAVLFVAWPYGMHDTAIALRGARVLVIPESAMIGLALTLACAFLSLGFGLRREELSTVLPGAAATVFAIPYIGLTLGALVLLRDLRYGPWLVLYLFVVVWSGDIFAYYTGRAIGRHKLAPRVSPGKTWEGAAASFAGSIGLGVLMFAFQPEITAWLVKVHALEIGSLQAPPLVDAIGLSALLNIVAQFGDLFESALKRGAGVKDSGTLLPGHGGILDRIDALLFAAPVLWYYAFFSPMFHPI